MHHGVRRDEIFVSKTPAGSNLCEINHTNKHNVKMGH